MSDTLVMQFEPNIDDERQLCEFYRKLINVYTYCTYDDKTNMYSVYDTRKYQGNIQINTQIGKHLRKTSDEMLYLDLVEYNIGFDHELLDFIQEYFPAIDSYLEEKDNYDICVGLGRLFNSQSFESLNVIDTNPSFCEEQDIRRIFALLYLIRKINFGSELDEYSQTLALHPYILKNVNTVIHKNSFSMYHIKYLMESSGDIPFELPLILENETLVNRMSQNVVCELPETKFCYWFNELISRRVSNSKITNMVNFSIK